jgi:hypothetical protein
MVAQLSRKERYDEYLNSSTWRRQRGEAFVRWGRFCNCCGENDAIHVHHLNYRNLVDVTADDLMPLCERCHERVHVTPELDQMARVHGDPMEKRRHVIKLVKTVWVAKGAGGPSPAPAAQKPLSKKKLNHLARLERKRMEMENSTKREVRKALASELTQKIVCGRFNIPLSDIQHWPPQVLSSVFHRTATPVLARPTLLREINACDSSEMITLTRDDMTALRTERGGFTRVTIKALGAEMDDGHPMPGWFRNLVGTTIPRAQYLRALAGKNIYSGAAKHLIV